MIGYLTLLWVVVFVAELAIQKVRLNPARALGIILFTLSKTLIPLWEFSKFSQGSGITTYLEFPRSDSFEISLLISAIAMQLISLFFGIKFRQSKLKIAEALSSIKIRANTYSAVLLALWAVGQGTSLIARNGYLQSNGELLLLRPLAFLAPLLAVFLYISGVLGEQNRKVAPHILAGVWFVLLMAIGSRSSLLFLVVFFSLLFRLTWRSKVPAFKFALLAIESYLGVYLFLLVFSATLYARLNPHGISRVIQMLNHGTSPGIVPDSLWIDTFSSLAISFASSYPIISLSIYSVVPATLLLINANPLPTEFLGIAPNNSAEFILPWLPKAVIGEIYGAVGPIGLFTSMVIMGAIAMYFYGRATKRGEAFLALAIGVVFIASILLSLQYPSRVVFRIYSLTYLLPLLVWLWRSVTNKKIWSNQKNDAPKEKSPLLPHNP
jgi:iron complex transport system permease protein